MNPKSILAWDMELDETLQAEKRRAAKKKAEFEKKFTELK